MSQADLTREPARGRVIGLQERRLGRTLLRTYRTKVNIDDVVPNERQPRVGAREDEELQRQIEANEGLFEPLLVEPHPDIPGRFRIIDGGRRWTNSLALVKQGREQYRQVPVEVTDRTLSDDERLRVWIYIQRQRKEWETKEKEMVAHRLVELVGRASAANILGTTVRELDKLVEVFELSEKFTGLREPGAAITWARELMGVSKKLLTPSITEAVVNKVNQKRITNSKDLRKLRPILRDPVARQHFLSKEGDLESAMLRIGRKLKKPKAGLAGDLEAAIDAITHVPWTTIDELRGDSEILRKIEKAELLLKSLRKTLSS
jgi:ParB family chromosome partitioning protein